MYSLHVTGQRTPRRRPGKCKNRAVPNPFRINDLARLGWPKSADLETFGPSSADPDITSNPLRAVIRLMELTQMSMD